MAAGNGPECCILFDLEVLHAAVTEGWSVNGSRIVDDRTTDGFVCRQKDLLAATPVGPGQLFEDVIALTELLAQAGGVLRKCQEWVQCDSEDLDIPTRW